VHFLAISLDELLGDEATTKGPVPSGQREPVSGAARASQPARIEAAAPAALRRAAPAVARPAGPARAAVHAARADGKPVVVQHGVQNPVIDRENGVRWERLAGGTGGPVDPLLVTYEPGSSSSAEGRLMRHGGFEYVYLLAGSLTVLLGDSTLQIHAGDSLNFDSIRPHLFENHGSEPAQGLWFVVRKSPAADRL
jgi:quercetin dioxygenase-like cupin family protein